MKYFKNPYMKIVIIFAIIILILELVANKIISGSIFMIPFCIIPLFMGIDGLINKRLHSRVDHTKIHKAKFNIDDIVVHSFTLLIGIIMCIIWFKVFYYK